MLLCRRCRAVHLRAGRAYLDEGAPEATGCDHWESFGCGCHRSDAMRDAVAHKHGSRALHALHRANPCARRAAKSRERERIAGLPKALPDLAPEHIHFGITAIRFVPVRPVRDSRRAVKLVAQARRQKQARVETACRGRGVGIGEPQRANCPGAPRGRSACAGPILSRSLAIVLDQSAAVAGGPEVGGLGKRLFRADRNPRKNRSHIEPDAHRKNRIGSRIERPQPRRARSGHGGDTAQIAAGLVFALASHGP